MEEKSAAHNSSRIIRLSRPADYDLSAIYHYTAREWDEDQAEKYQAFLLGTIRRLAENSSIVSIVPHMQGLRVYLARWNNTRDGHRIFFEETDNEVFVVRILHTAMNWQEHLRLKPWQ